MPGEQFLQPRGGVITDAREHVGEPGARIDVVQLCRLCRTLNYAERFRNGA